MTQPKSVSKPFRPRARLLQLLGDELIGSPRLAVFELVKNAYDADARTVTARFELDGSDGPQLSVTDDGEGMSLKTLMGVWLVPGHDHRSKQRASLVRSPKYHRLPLGEKGVGRFAVHKLGDKITVVTRAKKSRECVIAIDWTKLTSKKYLDGAPVTISVRDPELFSGDKTGTSITIGKLRSAWTRGEVRRLFKQVTTISSPFSEASSFTARVEVPGHEDWVADLPEVQEILDRAIYRFSFTLTGDLFSWEYDFRSVPGMALKPRKAGKKKSQLLLPPDKSEGAKEGEALDLSAEGHADQIAADDETLEGIGPVSGVLYVYDRDKEVLKHFASPQLTTDYLNDQGGIRVYRDGIRVYNYGEPGDDWLGLDLRRVNSPVKRISRNIVLGSINLSLAGSTSLREKTNREGFVENSALHNLRRVVIGALAVLEAERNQDKERIREITDGKVPGGSPRSVSISGPLADLRKALDRHRLRETLEPYVARIEHDYREMQDTLLSAGMSGLNLAVVFHEVERGVSALHGAISSGVSAEETSRRARDLMQLLNGFTALLRRDTKKMHSARSLIEAARDFSMPRLRHHGVSLECPILEGDQVDFKASFAFGIVLGALSNLIDNSLYWLRARWPKANAPGAKRRLYVGVTHDLEPGPAIVVADNGPGFGEDDPELLVRPFFTRKPTGMGLGLYYSSMAMELNGGVLLFPDREDAEVPERFDGAVTALAFRKTST